MKYHRFVLPVMGLVFALAASPTPLAWAAGWIAPVEGAVVSVSFGALGPSGVHRGVDIPADPGAQVFAPSAGVVSFAGAVPADGGGTCGAITIETPDGQRISMLPLDAVHVSKGATVEAGATVGRLAASGDDSADAPHLHLGLRRGDQYLDPSPFLECGSGNTPASPAVGGEPGVSPGGASPADSPAVAPGATASHAVSAPSASVQSAARAVIPAPEAASCGLTSQTRADLRTTAEAPVSSAGAVTAGHDAFEYSPTAASSGDEFARLRLVRDAGISPGSVDSRQVTGAAAAAAGTRWVSARRLGGPARIAPGSFAPALAALAVIACGVIPLIARSKVLLRVR